MQWGISMYGYVTALTGVTRDREMKGQKHTAHMLQAFGLGSSQVSFHDTAVFASVGNENNQLQKLTVEDQHRQLWALFYCSGAANGSHPGKHS